MKYHIYSVGNALVDLEFEVTDKELAMLKVDKGVMTLINQERHHRLISDLSGIKHAKASGGSAANTITTAQLLGAKTFFSCRVADDKNGEFYMEDFRKRGMTTNLDSNNRPAGVTGKCIVMTTPDAERSMCTYLGICDTLSETDLCPDAIANSQFVYTEGYLVTDTLPFAAALKAHQFAKQYGVKRAITLSDPNIVMFFKDNLQKILKDPVDLLFCNEKEALLFSGTEDLKKSKDYLKQYAKTFVITLGSKGSVAFDGEQFHHSPAAAANVIDTLGAGDTFAGAFMYALSHCFNYAEANKLANIAAGKIVAKYGPRINLDDAKIILNQFGTTSKTFN